MKCSFSFPQKINVAVNGNLNSLIDGFFDGRNEDYLISDIASKKNIVFWLAYNIFLKYGYLYSVEAKYNFGFRDKRIEIAFFDGNYIILGKVIRDKNRLDKEAMSLDTIARDIENKNKNVKLIICLFLNSYNNVDVFKNVQAEVKSKLLFIDINHFLSQSSNKNILELNLLK